MKRASAVTALTLLFLAMPVAADCGHDDPSNSASATPRSQLAATPVPAVTKGPTFTSLKAPASKAAAKPAADKNRNKEAAPDEKVAAASIK